MKKGVLKQGNVFSSFLFSLKCGCFSFEYLYSRKINIRYEKRKVRCYVETKKKQNQGYTKKCLTCDKNSRIRMIFLQKIGYKLIYDVEKEKNLNKVKWLKIISLSFL